LQAGEFVRWPRETPLLPVLTAKIVPHMFRIMLTGVLPRTPVLLIIPARGQAGWRTCHRSFNGI
jgi:hypothetical protein